MAGTVPRPDLAVFSEGPGPAVPNDFEAYKAEYEAKRAAWLSGLTPDQQAELELGSSKVKINQCF